MALIYKTGDILKATENVICHQVNVDGVMGGGLALQIARAYPKICDSYRRFCSFYNNNYETLKGRSMIGYINESQYIANCFTQKPNFDTDYRAIYDCFTNLLQFCRDEQKTLAVPYKYGCGIANGDWKFVEKIFTDISKEFDVDIVVYTLSDK